MISLVPLESGMNTASSILKSCSSQISRADKQINFGTALKYNINNIVLKLFTSNIPLKPCDLWLVILSTWQPQKFDYEKQWVHINNCFIWLFQIKLNYYHRDCWHFSAGCINNFKSVKNWGTQTYLRLVFYIRMSVCPHLFFNWKHPWERVWHKTYVLHDISHSAGIDYLPVIQRAGGQTRTC